MLNAKDVLAEGVLSCRDLLKRFLAGFDDDNRTRQADGLPNHLVWTLGHVSLYFHRTAERIDGRPLPEADFFAGDGKGGDAERYDTGTISFNSAPADESDRYPRLARGLAVFDGACGRLADAVRGAEAETLEQTVEWAGSELPLWGLVQRVTFHCGCHTGQIMDLRRALGLGRVIG